MKSKAIVYVTKHFIRNIFYKRIFSIGVIIKCTAMILFAKYQADKMFCKYRNRYYAVYNPQYKRMFVIPYSCHGMVSYKYLFHRGMFAGAMLTPAELKTKCCYYSASLHSPACDGLDLRNKIKTFAMYYSIHSINKH